MMVLSLAESCRLLAIDAKTLHRWLGLAHLSVQAHPLDARLRCVTREQIEDLAAIHHRSVSASSELFFSASSSAPSTLSQASTASVWSAVDAEVSGPISALTQHLGSLHAQVLTLQQQLALLTEHLQKDLQWRTHVIKMSAESSLESSVESSLDNSAESSLKKEARPASIDRRKHPRVLPLVEYGAQGTYVVISPEEGLLSFEPDSPEWFAWLSTLPSFRFVGKGGRFTAFRGYQPTARMSWWAHRQIHGQSQRRRLGLTTSVTVACLELAASSLQALVSERSFFEPRCVLPPPLPSNKCHCSVDEASDRCVGGVPTTGRIPAVQGRSI